MHRILLAIRPDYYNGQVLDDEDFLREQDYHRSARRQHNRLLHGWGVVHGLEVSQHTPRALEVSPGLAIDQNGDEIALDKTEILDLPECAPNETLEVRLDKEPEKIGRPREEKKERKEFAVLGVFPSVTGDNSCCDDGASAGTFLVLGTISLDDHGSIVGIDGTKRKYSRPPLAPESVDASALGRGSVGPRALSSVLRKGWLRMAFCPHPIDPEREGDKEIPRFRVGVTRAQTALPQKEVGAVTGAKGAMPIPIPPNAVSITKFRIAGEKNEGQITVELWLGGFNKRNFEKKESPVHIRELLFKETIKSGGNDVGFCETFDIPPDNRNIDQEWNTLSVAVECTGAANFSLVAAEFSYYDDDSCAGDV